MPTTIAATPVQFRFSLLALSTIYLALPVLIFAAGWLRGWLALLLIAANLLALIHCTRQRSTATTETTPNWTTGLGFLLGALALTALAGAGGWGFQDRDWEKHSVMLKTLIEQSWPAHRSMAGESFAIIYYLAYYLPAALAGKWLGWVGANHLLFGWSVLGVWLALFWFARLIRDHHPFAVLPFALFSGLDVVGKWLITPWLQRALPELTLLPVDYQHIEWWTGRFQYSSNVTQLFWVPQQCLAGWIGTGLLLHELERERPRLPLLVWVWSLLWLWSPFVAIGLAPYLLGALWLHRCHFAWADGAWLLISALINLAVIGPFYLTKLYPLPTLSLAPTPFGLTLGSVTSVGDWSISFATYLIFCLLEFGLFAVVLWQAWRGEAATREVATKQPAFAYLALRISIFLLLLLPLIRYGWYNDLTMRASLPALFVLNVYVVRTLYQPDLSTQLRWLLAALLWIGSATPFFEMYRHVTQLVERGALVQLQPVEEVRWSQLRDWEQAIYLGAPDTPFFKFLARR